MVPRPTPAGPARGMPWASRVRTLPWESMCSSAKLLEYPRVSDASPFGGTHACACAAGAPQTASPTLATSGRTRDHGMLALPLLALGRRLTRTLGHGLVDDGHVVLLFARGLHDTSVLAPGCGQL